MTKQVEKGAKYLLKRVKVLDQNNEVAKEYHDRNSIENEIAKYNKLYFHKAYSSNTFKDKTYSKLKEEHIKDKILNGTLKREEYDNDNVYEFMRLLEKPGGY